MDTTWGIWDGEDVDGYLGSVDVSLPQAVYPMVSRRLGGVAGQVVLDYGCGDSRSARWFAHQGAARVIGVDLSPEMIAAAGSRLPRGVPPDRAQHAGVPARCFHR